MPENEADKWTEEKLRVLSSDEHDFQEYKSSQYLVNVKKEVAGDFLVNLSKQVSAFANAGGGTIFLGIQDDGTPDDGIPMDLKKGGTRSWLEDIIPNLVIPTLESFNVFEIPASLEGSPIAKGNAVYVIHIEHTPTPPYQAKDQRYYTRIAGKSKPMPHIHVADAFRRVRSPIMALARFSPYGSPEIDHNDPRGTRVFMAFRVHFLNTSRIMAKRVGAEVTLPRILVGKEVRNRIELSQKTSRTQRPDKISFFQLRMLGQ